MVNLRFTFLFSLFLFVFLYFSYHLLSGEKTVFRFIDNGPKILEREAELGDLRERRLGLENRVGRFRDGSIDLDLLEEEVRRKFHYLREDEAVLPLGD